VSPRPRERDFYTVAFTFFPQTQYTIQLSIYHVSGIADCFRSILRYASPRLPPRVRRVRHARPRPERPSACNRACVAQDIRPKVRPYEKYSECMFHTPSTCDARVSTRASPRPLSSSDYRLIEGPSSVATPTAPRDEMCCTRQSDIYLREFFRRRVGRDARAGHTAPVPGSPRSRHRRRHGRARSRALCSSTHRLDGGAQAWHRVEHQPDVRFAIREQRKH
jgi:hypothetical protein